MIPDQLYDEVMPFCGNHIEVGIDLFAKIRTCHHFDKGMLLKSTEKIIMRSSKDIHIFLLALFKAILLINRFVGLGLLALLFSFNLFTGGDIEVQTASTDSTLLQYYQEQNASLTKFDGDHQECGLIEPRLEINELQEVLRKFTVATGSDTVIINPSFFSCRDVLSEAYLFVAGQVDFSIRYHNLRI